MKYKADQEAQMENVHLYFTPKDPYYAEMLRREEEVKANVEAAAIKRSIEELHKAHCHNTNIRK